MTAEGVDHQPLPMAQCALDRPGLQSQLARYGELSRQVERVKRWPGLLEVDFRPQVDADLLSEAIAVERECCPFFELSYDALARRLSITVENSCHDAALDGLRFALTPSQVRSGYDR